jgi:hypothetical protein
MTGDEIVQEIKPEQASRCDLYDVIIQDAYIDMNWTENLNDKVIGMRDYSLKETADVPNLQSRHVLGNGTEDDSEDGSEDGFEDGSEDGFIDGSEDGSEDGFKDGSEDGSEDGFEDGSEDGSKDGFEDCLDNELVNDLEEGLDDDMEDGLSNDSWSGLKEDSNISFGYVLTALIVT